MTPRPGLPPDSHVHSQWSWDADRGDMDATCARAVAIGLPAVAFTEHLDCIDRCRSRDPQLLIMTGVEVGPPHRHRDDVAAILARGDFERVLGSLHCLPDGDAYAEPWELVPRRPPQDILRDYLLEVPRMVAAADLFDAVAHIDYPLRSRPRDVPYDPVDVEDEWREALRAVAATGRALEVNTRLPMDPTLIRWWREEGGTAVTIGSDAHEPELVGTGLREALAMVSAQGFRVSPSSADFLTLQV